MRFEFAAFMLAIQFLTRLPVDSSKLYSAGRMAASVRYYPLVGALVGGLMALVFMLCLMVFSNTLSIAITITAGVMITGAFHEDGLADTADGIGGGHTRQRTLEIMRDSRLGTYGMLALMCALLLKYVALSEISAAYVPGLLITAHILSRASSVMVIATSTYVRDEGTGKPVAQRLSRGSFTTVVCTSMGAILIACYLVLPGAALIYGLVGLILGHLMVRLLCERKLGGYTGDMLGAVQQLSEIGFYLGCISWLSS